ncbi:MAG: ATP-binding protein [Candidatus Micrarchaeota archaeon]|nr:ATP-binding protein [Candidatus Micrarchaeota archaeon]
MEDTDILQILYAQNPWWEGKPVQAPEQKRRDFYFLKKTLADKQITAIIGPRRVGKSVLMQQLIKDLVDQKVPPKHILFAQLDEPKFENGKNLLIGKILETYFKHILEKSPQDLEGKIFVFLDEVQDIEKWSEVLKSYYDRNYKMKFVVSGSSAAGITRGSSESLAGRVSIHLVLTLKFVDYLKFKGVNGDLDDISLKLRYKIKDALDENNPELLWSNLRKFSAGLVPRQHRIETLLGEYMVKGGYIELLDQNDYGKCLQYLKDLLQLVIYKDMVKVFGVRNPKNIEELLLFLGNHSAELFSESSTSAKLGIKNQTVSEYMEYLEDTFLVSMSMIYAANRSKQIRNPRKVYLTDNGIRNVLNGTYSPKALTDSKDVGLIAETAAHNHLLRLGFFLDPYNSKCYYWKNGSEIDNVIVYAKKPIPVEVKYQNDIGSEDLKGCKEFMKENDSLFAIMITKNKLDYKDKVFYIPLWYFLLIC